MSTNNIVLTKERINYIDALRGLAIIGSLDQHIGMWLYEGNIMDNPLMLAINGMGGFAGPLFVTLAGLSALLLTQRYDESNQTLVKRGLIVILYGYLLSLAAPGFLSWGAWFVLHIIGFGILVTPLLRRLPVWALMVTMLVVVVLTVVGQSFLNTPLYLSWGRMQNVSMNGGVLRLILFEGHFPVFLWMSFFAGGMLIGKLLTAGKITQLTYLAVSSFLIAGIIFIVNQVYSPGAPFARLFAVSILFYPVTPFFFFTLFPLVIVCLLVFRAIGLRWHFKASNPLVCLGRSSITIYFSHIIIGAALVRANAMPSFPGSTMLVPLAVIFVVFAALAVVWQRYDYKYGPEWLLRKV